MFCINCGTPLPDEAKFCYKCGCKQEIKTTLPMQKKEFSYSNLVQYEFERVEMVENYNSYNKPNEKRAFVVVQKYGKLGVYDECFEHLFVPCDYDSISIYTQYGNALFKVIKDHKCYLFQNNQMILDKGYDDIYIQNSQYEPCAIEYKDCHKYGFRLKQRIPSERVGLCKYTYSLYDATYDSVSINDKERVVLVKKGTKYGMISMWGSELPCLFDSIIIERRPAKFDSSAHLLHTESGYQRRWLILKYNGIEHEYPEMLIREPNKINYVFDIQNYNILFLMD